MSYLVKFPSICTCRPFWASCWSEHAVLSCVLRLTGMMTVVLCVEHSHFDVVVIVCEVWADLDTGGLPLVHHFLSAVRVWKQRMTVIFPRMTSGRKVVDLLYCSHPGPLYRHVWNKEAIDALFSRERATKRLKWPVWGRSVDGRCQSSIGTLFAWQDGYLLLLIWRRLQGLRKQNTLGFCAPEMEINRVHFPPQGSEQSATRTNKADYCWKLRKTLKTMQIQCI